MGKLNATLLHWRVRCARAGAWVPGGTGPARHGLRSAI